MHILVQWNFEDVNSFNKWHTLQVNEIYGLNLGEKRDILSMSSKPLKSVRVKPHKWHF